MDDLDVEALVAQARVVVATSTDDSSLMLADLVLEMHEDLRQAGPLPFVWSGAVRTVVEEQLMLQKQADFEISLVLVWMLNEAPNNTIEIPYEQLGVVETTIVDRKHDHDRQCLVFSLAPPESKPRPTLTLIKEN